MAPPASLDRTMSGQPTDAAGPWTLPPINGSRTPELVAELRPIAGPKTPTRRATDRLSAYTNRIFYAVVLGVALTGAGLAATDWLDWWPPFAFAAVAAVELGGVALSVHSDHRRRLGERAVVARILSASVAAGAVAVNWFGHGNHLGQAAFFSGMSALGYLVWLIDSGARRRDALRRERKLEETAPSYGLDWLRHPEVTRRARSLALETPTLGKLGSLRAAREEIAAERRAAAIARVLRKQIAEWSEPDDAEIAVWSFDLDKIARQVAERADYDGFTELISTRLRPGRVARSADVSPELPSWRRALIPAEADAATAPELPAAPAAGTSADAPPGSSDRRPAGTKARKLTGTHRRKRAPERAPRRTVEETRKLAAELLAAKPELTQEQVAAQLGISDRRLRAVLNHPTSPKEPTP